MSKKLNVFLGDVFVGELTQDDHGDLSFQYAKSWLENPSRYPLSHSLPFQEKPFDKKACRPFFAGILPEEHKRDLIAKNLGVSRANDFSLLEKIGGECGGAVEFFLPHKKSTRVTDEYKPLSEQELSGLIQDLKTRPLLAGKRGIRLSLAGVQDKLPIRYSDKKFFLPLKSAPSTHIIKPAIPHFPGQIYNESFCLKLAKHLKIPTADAETFKWGETEFLLVKRYDRALKDNSIERLHQEDFCQALGIIPEKKYQSEGGPTLQSCFELIKKVSSNPVLDLENLLKAVMFNILIGNNDAHGKNFSLLYQKTSCRLAPLYDLISTAFYKDLDTHMAMKVGSEANSLKLKEKHIEALAKDLNLSAALVKRYFRSLINQILDTLLKIPYTSEEEPFADFIKTRVKRFKSVF
ncbi:MAG: type II toxin-antitoxin system HipA family toxin [Chlamydiia bacterium]|nr:type II toxin-antitoxin system HipA family toxin [Chlamydiia bacterium]